MGLKELSKEQELAIEWLNKASKEIRKAGGDVSIYDLMHLTMWDFAFICINNHMQLLFEKPEN